jgi:hypothetical protein
LRAFFALRKQSLPQVTPVELGPSLPGPLCFLQPCICLHNIQKQTVCTTPYKLPTTEPHSLCLADDWMGEDDYL